MSEYGLVPNIASDVEYPYNFVGASYQGESSAFLAHPSRKKELFRIRSFLDLSSKNKHHKGCLKF